MNKAKNVLKYLFFPITIVLFIVKMMMKSNVDSARKDMESAEEFEKQSKDKIIKIGGKIKEIDKQQTKTEKMIEAIEENTSEDWYKDE